MLTAQEINILVTWIIIFLCIICVLAIAGIVIYDDVSRRKFNKDIKLSRRDYMAETVFTNLKAGPNHTIEVWHDELTHWPDEQFDAFKKDFMTWELNPEIYSAKEKTTSSEPTLTKEMIDDAIKEFKKPYPPYIYKMPDSDTWLLNKRDPEVKQS